MAIYKNELTYLIDDSMLDLNITEKQQILDWTNELRKMKIDFFEISLKLMDMVRIDENREFIVRVDDLYSLKLLDNYDVRRVITNDIAVLDELIEKNYMCMYELKLDKLSQFEFKKYIGKIVLKIVGDFAKLDEIPLNYYFVLNVQETNSDFKNILEHIERSVRYITLDYKKTFNVVNFFYSIDDNRQFIDKFLSDCIVSENDDNSNLDSFININSSMEDINSKLEVYGLKLDDIQIRNVINSISTFPNTNKGQDLEMREFIKFCIDVN